MSRGADSLETLRRQVAACRICVEHPRGKPLPHEPRPVVQVSARSRILIASQAPGMRVQLSGVPFDDRSGDRLRDWLGVTRGEFYEPDNFAILPMGFCFPGYDAHGGDKPPRRECAPAWREQLLALMPRIDLVLVIGSYAQAWHLGDARERSVNDTVANWRRIFDRDADPRTLPLPHPSWRNTGWLKKNSWFETELLPVLRAEVKSRIGL